MTIDERVDALREKMEEHQLAAYLIPSSDPHQSEYLASHWRVREWISGFTGSSGFVIVTPAHAGLWTDSRYFLQAETELSSTQIELHKLRIPHTPQHTEWLYQNIPAGSTIGCDGSLFSLAQLEHLQNVLADKNITIATNLDLFPMIWEDRPDIPSTTAFALDDKFCGESRAQKLTRVKAAIQKQGATHHLIADLSDIAWLLNIRSNDIEFNPVFISFLLIAPEGQYLFTDEDRIETSLRAKLNKEGILTKAYNEIKPHLQSLPAKTRILIDTSSLNISLYESMEHMTIIRKTNPTVLMRAIKNQTEIEHIKEAMRKDGVALTMLYHWLEKELEHRSVTEVEVADYLANCRKAQGDYHSESFPAIVGYAGNGAIVHYRPMPETCANIKQENILLLDSGGQYLKGTTDITRTTALGVPTEEQKRNFTLVLKGHIGLASLKFPAGTRGNQMEILARQHLWKHGLNYGHGTGHGVGFFLNVHEGPQSLGGGMTAKASTVIQPGMLTSNEPGYYKEGAYGIRIENLILCEEDQETPFGQFLKFDTITLFPIDHNLIKEELLTTVEQQWLEKYHQKVYDELAPRLSPEHQEWLKNKCRL